MPPTLPPARTSAPRAGAPLGDVRSSAASILRRKDVAVVPLSVMSAASFALVLAQEHTPHAMMHNPSASSWIVPEALAVGTLTGGFALALQLGWGRRLRATMWLYMVVGTLLLGALAALALLDSGVATVGFSGVFLVAPYVGLVMPKLLSRVSIAAILAIVVGVQLARPTTHARDFVAVFVLVIAGWTVGLIPRMGHRLAFKQALLLSRSDLLTGAQNRRGFIEELAYDLGLAARMQQPVALLGLDLDGFKQVNDAHGHAAGDAMLAWLGETVPPVLPPGAAFGRIGGDEFAVALPGATVADARALAARLHDAIAPRIEVSIGIGSTPDGAVGLEALLHATDTALYSAKGDPAERVHHREARAAGEAPPKGARPPVVSFARLRADQMPASDATKPTSFDGRWW